MYIKSKFRFAILLLFFFLGLVLLVLYCQYLKEVPDFNPKKTISASELYSWYHKESATADDIFTDKIVRVYGEISAISFLNQRETIFLKTEFSDAWIICDMDKSQVKKVTAMKKKQTISVYGVCKGFLKDVVLLNCKIDASTNED